MKQRESHSDVQIRGVAERCLQRRPSVAQCPPRAEGTGRPPPSTQHVGAVMSKMADNGTEPSKDYEQQQLCLFSGNYRGTWTSILSAE